MVQFINVSRIYDNRIAAIDDLNFSIADGEFVFLIGPSGSGKTTVIKMLIRDEVPSEGKIYFDDLDITKINRQQVYKIRREIGVIFQDYKLVQDKTAYENVAFAMEAAGKRNKEIKETVPYVLDIVGLSNRMNAFPRQLSGGEQQRVAIARAIANNPKILIADEPTGNLDPASAWDIVQILSKINNWGTTVIMSTHGTDIVNSLNKRVIQMDRGRVIRDDNKGQYEMEDAKTVKIKKTSVIEDSHPLQKDKKRKTFFKTSLSDSDDTGEEIEPVSKKTVIEKQIDLSKEESVDENDTSNLKEGDIIYKRRKLLGFIPFFGKKKFEVHKSIEEVLESKNVKGLGEFSRESHRGNYPRQNSPEESVEEIISEDEETVEVEEVEEQAETFEEPEVVEKPKKVKKAKNSKKNFNTKLDKKDTMAKEIQSESEEDVEEVSLKNKKVSKQNIEDRINSKSTPIDVLDLPKRILKDLEVAGYNDIESIIKDGPDKLSKRITIDPEEVVIISKAIKIFLEE